MPAAKETKMRHKDIQIVREHIDPFLTKQLRVAIKGQETEVFEFDSSYFQGWPGPTISAPAANWGEGEFTDAAVCVVGTTGAELSPRQITGNTRNELTVNVKFSPAPNPQQKVRITRNKMRFEQRPVIVDDGLLAGQEDPLMKRSEADAQGYYAHGYEKSSEDFWYKTGEAIYAKFQKNEPVGIRCDGCTALAFYLLIHSGCTGAVTIIEQGAGGATGHWFLVVGCPDDAPISSNWFPRGCFGVDLWGAACFKQRSEAGIEGFMGLGRDSAVLDPARCDWGGMGEPKAKVHRAGTTIQVPDKAAFAAASARVRGVLDHHRADKLTALDNMLDKYQKNQARLDEVDHALTAWIGTAGTPNHPSFQITQQRSELLKTPEGRAKHNLLVQQVAVESRLRAQIQADKRWGVV